MASCDGLGPRREFAPARLHVCGYAGAIYKPKTCLKKLAKLFENARARSQAYAGAETTTVNSETDAEAPWHAARSWARRPAGGVGSNVPARHRRNPREPTGDKYKQHLQLRPRVRGRQVHALGIRVVRVLRIELAHELRHQVVRKPFALVLDALLRQVPFRVERGHST